MLIIKHLPNHFMRFKLMLLGFNLIPFGKQATSLNGISVELPVIGFHIPTDFNASV